MTDLRERFEAAEHMPAPRSVGRDPVADDLGPQAQAERPSTARRVATIVVAFAIFGAVALVFGKAFDTPGGGPGRPDAERALASTPPGAPARGRRTPG